MNEYKDIANSKKVSDHRIRYLLALVWEGELRWLLDADPRLGINGGSCWTPEPLSGPCF